MTMIRSTLFRKLAVSLAPALFLCGPSFSQSNEVFVGQTGETNTITILQDGLANTIGGDQPLGLNQFGGDNTITIDQIGAGNVVATTMRFEADETLAMRLRGTNQAGDANRIAIDQRSTAGTPDAGSVIGSLRQIAPDDFAGPGASNRLTVTQISDRGLGHAIEQVLQRRLPPLAGGPNRMTIRQTGSGQTIGSLRQEGAGGNAITVGQSDANQAIDRIGQQGRTNNAVVRQQGGGANRLDELRQTGTANRAEIVLDGAGIDVLGTYQNNEGLSGDGNTLALTLEGRDHGGASQASVFARTGVAASRTSQIGTGNAIRFTTGAETQNVAFGLEQEGDQNIVVGTIVGAATGSPDGLGPAAAIRQQGDGNLVTFEQTNGIGSGLAVTMTGDRNALDARQAGPNQRALVTITGDETNSADAFGFAADGLRPGELIQSGSANEAAITVTGDANAFAVRQAGTANIAAGVMAGRANRAVISQIGAANRADFAQAGNGNLTVIRQ